MMQITHIVLSQLNDILLFNGYIIEEISTLYLLITVFINCIIVSHVSNTSKYNSMMYFRKLQIRICQQYYSYEVFSFCPLFVILGCCARIICAFHDVFQVIRYGHSSRAKLWYYDKAMYSENILAICISHILVIIILNALLLIGILKDDENVFSYPWIMVEFVEIILQIVGLFCEFSFSSFYGLLWKVNYWLVTGCLLLGRSCAMKS